MSISFAGTLDRDAVLETVAAIGPLVRAPQVAAAWRRESALPGMSVGAVARHLVSQAETAVEFLAIPVPTGPPTLGLIAYADTLDWLDAPVEAPENTSIRDDFEAMAAAGPEEAVAAHEAALAALPEALAAAGPTTFVPWQGVTLATDDFLVMRLLEIAVHTDDLAVSIGLPAPDLPSAAIQPVVALLGCLALRRHPQADVIRVLARAERAQNAVSAF